MRSATAVMVLLFSACPTASFPDGGSQPDEDGGPIGCPEGFVEFPLIDFGCVGRGDSLALTLPDTFGLIPGVPTAPEFMVDGSSVRFSPTEERESQATLLFFRGPCVLGRQRLQGTGVDAVVKWTPALVDFGYASPGMTRTANVTFRSCAIQPLVLTNLQTREGASPALSFGFDAGSNLTLPAARRDPVTNVMIPTERSLELSCTPMVLGPRQGQFTATLPVAAQSMISVQLRCVGGGPVIDVMPKVLDFGTVTMATTQAVTIRNVGTRPQPPDPNANLHLGVDGGIPFVELDPPSCGTVMLSSYEPSVGLEPQNSVTVSVTLQPASMPRTCTLHVFSNDPNTPDVEVAITAQ